MTPTFWMTSLLVSLLAFMSVSVPVSSAQEEVSCDGPLQSESMRYPEMRVFPRAFRDLAAIPASSVAWDDKDWARFGAFALPTLTLMWPANPSLDTKFDIWLEERRTERGEKAFLKIKTLPISAALAGYGAIIFGTAWATDNDRLFEFGTLSLEALMVVQFWHVTTKVLLGRESPYQDQDGEFHSLKKISFPGGTPSGHAATTYAMLAVAAEYWDKMPLYVFAHAAGIYFSLSLVYHRQHFLSDVVWGAGMGYFMARWIVQHRSSRYRCKGSKQATWRDKMLVLPLPTERGFALTLSFFH